LQCANMSSWLCMLHSTVSNMNTKRHTICRPRGCQQRSRAGSRPMCRPTMQFIPFIHSHQSTYSASASYGIGGRHSEGKLKGVGSDHDLKIWVRNTVSLLRYCSQYARYKQLKSSIQYTHNKHVR